MHKKAMLGGHKMPPLHRDVTHVDACKTFSCYMTSAWLHAMETNIQMPSLPLHTCNFMCTCSIDHACHSMQRYGMWVEVLIILCWYAYMEIKIGMIDIFYYSYGYRAEMGRALPISSLYLS